VEKGKDRKQLQGRKRKGEDEQEAKKERRPKLGNTKLYCRFITLPDGP
jgi:hypothetical protein